jgi:creatinine amidohydrolase
METSLIQHLAPQWTLPLSEAGDGHERTFKVKALREGLAWSQRDWIETTADTGVGDPAPSTPEKGKKCLDDVSAKIAEFLVELAEADLADLYQD